MKTKFFIYFLPITLMCIFIFGYSITDNPKNDTAPGINSLENSNLSKSDLIQSKAPIAISNLNSKFLNEPNQSDTIAPTGFPYTEKFNWNYSLIPNVSAGTVGAITWKNKWYLNRWNLATNYRYNNNGTGGGPGTFADSNNAYNAGLGAIRDMTLAPDGSGTMYLWGGTGSTTLYKLDSLGNRVGTYAGHTGSEYRAIAWDPNRKGFWHSGFNTNIFCKDTLGNTIATIPATTITGKYGLGFDSSTVADSAYLWVWRQISTSQNELRRINLANQISTEIYVFNNSAVSVGLAGGAEVYKVDTNVYIALNFQNQAVISYDIKHKNPLPPNDVGVTSINSPGSVVDIASTPLTPSVTVKNFGSASNSFNVKVDITGGYTSTVSVGPLAPGATQVVNTFTSWNPPLGRYTVTAATILGSDVNPLNDSKTQSTEVYRPNWGGGYAGTGGYYFANSTASGDSAPSNPTYKRIDTTGSTSLVVNNVAATPLTKGSLDDGSWNISGITGPKVVRFMGNDYDSIFIGTNGIICFTNFEPSASSNWQPPAGGLPTPGAGTPPVRPAIYPLWNDINWGATAVPVNRLSYKIDNTKNLLLISYDRAPLFGAVAATDAVTMQICIELKNPAGSINSNLTVYYDSSSIVNVPLMAGLQNASGSEWLQYLYYDGTFKNAGPIYEAGSAGVAVAFGPDPNNLNGCCKTLNLKYKLESCPNPGAATIYLRNGTSPYALVDSSSGFGGGNITSTFDFANIANGVAYYVVVKTINSIETWSANTITYSGLSASYDFTTAINQAYGNNQKLSGGIPSIYQGDANQDGFVNLADISLVNNVSSVFATTPATDFNCDGTTDLSDLTLASNNSSNFIQKLTP